MGYRWVLAMGCAASLALGCEASSQDADTEEPGPAGGKADEYGPTGHTCGGFFRVAIDTSDELCMGLIAIDDFNPRVLLEIPERTGEFLVTDLAGWAPGEGRIWYMDTRNPQDIVLRPVLDGLTVPHQIIVGPGGWIYFGEDKRIGAFPPTAIADDGTLDSSQIEVVLDGLPPMDLDGERNSMHPITHFVFDDDGDMFVNIGAYTDHCNGFTGRECHETDGQVGESSDDPKDWGAVIRRYNIMGERTFDPDYSVVAMGLRNSMGLAFSPKGDLLQVENARDFKDGGRPFEELNVIPRAELDGEAPAKHYGWPYCYDAFETSPEWANFDFRCSPDNPEYRPPHVLLPPHSAPLGLVYYRGEIFDELDGKLIVPLHGYRPSGQRLLAFDVDDDGLPIRTATAAYLENPSADGTSIESTYPMSDHGLFAGQADYLITAWFAVDGFRPKGAPVAPYVTTDGALWIADDKNGSILRFDRAEKPLPPLRRENLYPAYRRLLDSDPEVLELYQSVVDDVLHSEQCTGCHDDFQLTDDPSRFPELRYLLTLGTWIQPGSPDESTLFNKLRPVGDAAMPPIDRDWDTQAQGVAAVDAVEAFIGALPELSPGINDGWVGGQCSLGFDVDCPFDGGRCTEDAFCTVECTVDSPFCDDRDGMRGTFCIDLGGGVGGCTVLCDPDAPGDDPDCPEGQKCEPHTRFGRTTPTKHVCR